MRHGALRVWKGWSLSLSAIAGALILATAPGAAACSVCMSGREDENQAAFIVTTIFLSVLPLLLIGGFGWYLRRRLQALDAANDAELPAAAASQVASR